MRSFVGITLVVVLAAAAGAADQKIRLQDMPEVVRQAVKEQSRGAVVRGYSKELENGKISYEAELTINGHSKDISFDEAGRVLAVEEEVALETIPVSARNSILKAAGTGKIKKVEQVQENGTTSYEATITKDGKRLEWKVDASGASVK
jgi:uncharacterized membrane protein YkoI